MKPSDPPESRLAKTLRRKQVKHRMLLTKVEKTALRLERRKLKLQVLESAIAELERRLADPQRVPGQAPTHAALRQVPLIFNPTAGPDGEDNAERLTEIVRCLQGHGIQPEIEMKTSGKAARTLARRAVRTAQPLVLVAGGDGTIEEVAAQLVGSETVLGIIPTGTMNNVARSLGIPLATEDACALIGMATVRHIDVGRMFSNDRPHVEYFMESAGVGLSAIAAIVGENLEKHHWRLLPRALRQLFKVKPNTIKVQMDDVVVESSSNIVTVANSPLMGSNLLVAPGAKMDDGLLDITLYEGMGTADLAKHFLATSKGQATELKSYRARHVRITADVPLPSNSDSDVTPERRMVEIEIVPRSLAVIAGNGIGLTVPVTAAPAPPPLSGGHPQTNGNHESEVPERTSAPA